MTRANDEVLELYRLMSFSRIFDRVIGGHDGHWHGLEGEEAAAVGAYFGLRATDVLAPHYRGSPLASYIKGADLRRLIAGMMGKPTGYNKGKHRNDVCGPWDFRLIGLYSGSLGPPLSYAAGAALSMKLDGRDNVAVAVFGDGTSSRGDVHEAMNTSSVLKLPIVFVCQNNQIAISTPTQTGVGGEIYRRAEGFGMTGRAVDGNDVLAVRGAMDEAIAAARAGKGPSLIELRTFRVAGHFYSDTEDYRDRETVDAWRRKDPIAQFSRYLLENDICTSQELVEIDSRLEAEISEAFQAALADPPPDGRDIDVEAVYAK
ncbi:MAG: thiamine pyrophosphate-dependent dehydrogenase E1 component subunit alpha [Pseudomonadota bacterium]